VHKLFDFSTQGAPEFDVAGGVGPKWIFGRPNLGRGL
jgi:hypothetical protein